jgi:ubiquinone/menaquinone biosynthesis C-methylase UbiE
MSNKGHVCPVAISGWLDNRIRRLHQNPQRILKPYVKKGMTVLDVGCGPGFFSVDMARMVGKSGLVIAADLQEAMLQKVREKIIGTELETRIKLHKCEENKIGVLDEVDFVLLFYMVHEVVNKRRFFEEIKGILKTTGHIFMVEPPFHVSKSAFKQSIKQAIGVGFKDFKCPNMLFHKTAILKKG